MRAALNESQVLNRTFDKPGSALGIFNMWRALVTGRIGFGGEFPMQDGFVANAAEQGVGTFCTISNIPAASLPGPAPLPLLLAGLAGLRLRADRAA